MFLSVVLYTSLWWGNATLWIHHLPTLTPSVDGVVNFVLVFVFVLLFLKYMYMVFCPNCLLLHIVVYAPFH